MQDVKKRQAGGALDSFDIHGRVEVFTTKNVPILRPGRTLSVSAGRPLYESCYLDFSQVEILDKFVVMNIIVDIGKDKVIQSLVSGFIHQIGRMAIGDRGTIPSDPTSPKVPVPTATALYNEVYRGDVDATVLDVGTPGVHEVQFIKTFYAADIPATSFSNPSAPVVNEVGLITFDSASPLPRAPVVAPTAPPADERLFSIRTFKSVPFQAANEIAVTIRYTIFIR